MASVNSLNELKSLDERYADFKPFKSGKVYNYNARSNGTGGNEYFELGYLRPDVLLRDLIKIRDPGLIDNELYFYKKIN